MQGYVALTCPWHCGVCLIEDFKCRAGNSEDAEQEERNKITWDSWDRRKKLKTYMVWLLGLSCAGSGPELWCRSLPTQDLYDSMIVCCHCRWCSLSCTRGLACQTLHLRGSGTVRRVEPTQQEELMWAARSWRCWPQLGLRTGRFPCVLLDFSTTDWIIWMRRNKTNLQKKVQEAALSNVSSTKAVSHLAEAGKRTHSSDMKTETEKVMSQCRNKCRITGQGQRGRMWKSIWRKS